MGRKKAPVTAVRGTRYLFFSVFPGCNTRLLLHRGTPKKIRGSFLFFLTASWVVRTTIRATHPRRATQVQAKTTLLASALSHMFPISYPHHRQGGFVFLSLFPTPRPGVPGACQPRQRDARRPLYLPAAGCPGSQSGTAGAFSRTGQTTRFSPHNRTAEAAKISVENRNYQSFYRNGNSPSARHSRESGNPSMPRPSHAPAFAGVTSLAFWEAREAIHERAFILLEATRTFDDIFAQVVYRGRGRTL